MARYRAAQSRIYVWAAPCPTCAVAKDHPCQDMRTGVRRSLYGRRTHQERRAAVKAMGNPRVIPPGSLRQRARTLRYAPATAYVPMGTITLTGTSTSTATSNQTYIQNTTFTTTGTWTVTRDEIWGAWVGTNTTTTGTVRFEWTDQQAQVWQHWDRQYERVLPRTEAIQAIRDEAQRLQEQVNRERLHRQQIRRTAAELEQAEATANELFLSLLTPEQRQQWVESEACHVRGSEGGLYELRSGGVHGNISLIDEHGCRLATLCVAPRMYEDDYGRTPLPTPDGWVGQLLAIRHNEGELKRIANYSFRRGCQNPGVPILGDRNVA